MSDLVQRLRTNPRRNIFDLCEEAAAEIERLRAELSASEAQLHVGEERPLTSEEIDLLLNDGCCQCENPIICCDHRGCNCTFCGLPERLGPHPSVSQRQEPKE